MLLGKHSRECCIPLTKLPGSLQIHDPNILLITRQNSSWCGGEAPLWGAAVLPRALGTPLGIPNNSSGRDCPSCGSWLPVPAPSRACLSQSLLSPKRLLRAVGVPAGEGSEGLGAAGSFPSQARGICCMFWEGRMCSEALRLGLLRGADWKPQRNLPGGQIQPKIKGTGSLSVDPHGFHSKSSAFAMLCIQPC